MRLFDRMVGNIASICMRVVQDNSMRVVQDNNI